MSAWMLAAGPYHPATRHPRRAAADALNTRILIEQAKGVVAERRHLNMEDAFNLLRSRARSDKPPLVRPHARRRGRVADNLTRARPDALINTGQLRRSSIWQYHQAVVGGHR
jgi:hypothetical protein